MQRGSLNRKTWLQRITVSWKPIFTRVIRRKTLSSMLINLRIISFLYLRFLFYLNYCCSLPGFKWLVIQLFENINIWLWQYLDISSFLFNSFYTDLRSYVSYANGYVKSPKFCSAKMYKIQNTTISLALQPNQKMETFNIIAIWSFYEVGIKPTPFSKTASE